MRTAAEIGEVAGVEGKDIIYRAGTLKRNRRTNAQIEQLDNCRRIRARRIAVDCSKHRWPIMANLPRRNEWIFSSTNAIDGRLAEPRSAHVAALTTADLLAERRKP